MSRTLGSTTSTWSYDPLGRLVAQADPIGTFTYSYDGVTSRLAALTYPNNQTSTYSYSPKTGDRRPQEIHHRTPGGATLSRFAYTYDAVQEPDSSTTRFIEATDPMGGTEHLEWHLQTATVAAAEPGAEVPSGFSGSNASLDRYNTLYWGKRTWALHPGDVTQATVTHWLMASLVVAGLPKSVPVPHSRKRPLERRVWYAYPNQSNLQHVGTSTQPSRVGVRLPDETSQTSAFTYNTLDQMTSSIDPLGRQTTYLYAANELDLLEVRQTTGGTSERLAAYSDYTAGHRPQTVTDAAGQVTALTYTAAGQVLTVTNPQQETSTYAYDADSRLTSVTGALPGAVTTIAYDGYGRPRTVTGPDGYTLTTDYDLFDRPTRVTYPDGTYEAWTYDRLDLATSRDFYDAPAVDGAGTAGAGDGIERVLGLSGRGGRHEHRCRDGDGRDRQYTERQL